MEQILPAVAGGLVAAGVYLLLRRSAIKMVMGFALLAQGVNLLLFLMGGLARGRPPLVPADATAPVAPYSDPLPQALILTAIVIGFGMQAFYLVLVRQLYETSGTDDTDQLKHTERGE
jgi:multicomponent Na+:H+ antiporter subunit C